MHRIPPVLPHMSSPISIESTTLSFWVLYEEDIFVSKTKPYTYLCQQAGDTEFLVDICKVISDTETLRQK